MRDLIENALRDHDADYCEIRVEESASTSILYRGKELEDIGRTTGIGGNVRAAVKGGWGFVSFNDLDNLDENVGLAVRQARLAAQTETRLAEVEPVVGVAAADVESDAADIPLADKKEIMDEYVDAAWSVSDKIQTSQIYYSDAHKKKYFANSEGTYTEQNRMYVRTGGVVIARDNGEVQQGRTSRASTSDFNVVRNLHGEFEKGGQERRVAARRGTGEERRVHGGAGPRHRQRFHPRGVRPPERGRSRLRKSQAARPARPGRRDRQSDPDRRRLGGGSVAERDRTNTTTKARRLEETI